jgi:hypothetical protein
MGFRRSRMMRGDLAAEPVIARALAKPISLVPTLPVKEIRAARRLFLAALGDSPGLPWQVTAVSRGAWPTRQGRSDAKPIGHGLIHAGTTARRRVHHLRTRRDTVPHTESGNVARSAREIALVFRPSCAKAIVPTAPQIWQWRSDPGQVASSRWPTVCVLRQGVGNALPGAVCPSNEWHTRRKLPLPGTAVRSRTLMDLRANRLAKSGTQPPWQVRRHWPNSRVQPRTGWPRGRARGARNEFERIFLGKPGAPPKFVARIVSVEGATQ